MIGRYQNADQRLDDELALRSLSTSYAAAVDLRDGDRFASLFVEHGELVVPNYPEDFRPSITRAGHDELRRIPEALRHYRRTFHQMSNHEFVIEGDTASGSVRCVAHHVMAAETGSPATGTVTSEGTVVVWFIRYGDGYRRIGDDWKFTRRTLHLEWVEERPVSKVAPGRS
jgi:hypothetical protein